MFKCFVILVLLSISSATPIHEDDGFKTDIEEFGEIIERLATVFEKG
jgi:hypothetical protein